MFQSIFTLLWLVIFTIVLFACSDVVEQASKSPENGVNVTVELMQPASGSVVSKYVAIGWSYPGLKPTRVKILLSNNSGDSYDRELATVSGISSYLWDSTDTDDGASYRIKLLPIDESNREGNVSEHIEDFTIDNIAPEVVNVSPTSGQTVSGPNVEITWQTNDSNLGTVNIRLSNNSGLSFDNVVAQDAVDNGSYSFNTAAYANGTTYQISIEATDGADNVGSVANSSDFEILNIAPSVGPKVTGVARFYDINFNNSADQGDELVVSFDQDIVINAPRDEDFALPVTGDSLGTSPAFALSASNEITITLGANATLRITGTTSIGSTQAGSPSGIDVSTQIAAGAITVPNGEITAEASQAIDIFPMYVESQLLRTCFTTGVSLGYFNADNFLDLAQSCDSLSLGTYIHVNDGNGNFTESYEIPANLANGVKFIDLNGDNFSDIVEINRFSGVDGTLTSNVYLNNKVGGFNTPQSLGPDTSTAYALVVADYTGDNMPDIIVGRFDLPSFLFINSNGVFSQSTTQIPATKLTGMYAEDVNNDGKMDLIIGGSNGFPHQIYLGDGAGNLIFLQDIPYTPTFGRISFGKLNNDSFIDIVLSSSASAATEVFYNNTDGTFSSSGISFGIGQVWGNALIDVDKDGDLDLFEATTNDIPAYVWINTGSGFIDSGARLANRQTRANIAVGDIDNDGDLDVVIGNAYQPSAIWKASYATP